ncbi:hypothetical protein [Gilvimarinus agarilyticus]|uniref:hypothetical protein n=1 Tax=Gilvimarinus agarilyticus TaxID=679259 RepID=UPI0005A15AFB|nr:hypothetical protein [Gilvimarinus agarilyticus]
MKRILDEAKKMITAKALLSASALGLFIPFIRLVYWIFDTAYLSGFGISPDVYSRPIFSSGFVSAWLVVEAIVPMMIVWTVFSAALFLLLLNINLGALGQSENRYSAYKIYSGDTRWTRARKRLLYALPKSFNWPYYTWTFGIVLIVFMLGVCTWATKKGVDLANAQLKAYAQKGHCIDKFTSNNKGCFRISGVAGVEHFLIANSETHLLYLSREGQSGRAEKPCGLECKTTLNIFEKKRDAQYSIYRTYVPMSDRELSETESKANE